MGERLTERIEVARVINVDDWNTCSLDDFIAELVALRDRQPAEIRPLLMVDAEAFGDYASACVTVVYDKTETDAEYQARLAQEELEKRKRAEKLMRDERRLYERLKEKYS